MEQKQFEEISNAIYATGWRISEIREEYERKAVPGADTFSSDYYKKTGAILMRITPEEEKKEV